MSRKLINHVTISDPKEVVTFLEGLIKAEEEGIRREELCLNKPKVICHEVTEEKTPERFASIMKIIRDFNVNK